MFNPDDVKRMNEFLEKYAAELEERGQHEKAVRIRQLTVPTILGVKSRINDGLR